MNVCFNKVVPFAARLVLVASLMTVTNAARADVEAAKSADGFVDSIGVNTHWAYDNVYTKSYTALKTKLGELGIRHIRDGAMLAVYAKATDLFNSYGIRTTLICGRRKPGPWPQPLNVNAVGEELAEIKTSALGATVALEGPNEYDISRPAGEADTWVNVLLSYQKSLYQKSKDDPALRNLPVIGPSLTSPQAYKEAGDLSPWLDYSCAHPYLSGRHPGTKGWGDNGYGSLDWTIIYQSGVQSPTKPVQFTECGYHNALETKSGHLPVSEAAEAKYLPRLFAEYFRHGNIGRAFKYELVNAGVSTTDIEANFGLLRNNLTEKSVFTAMKNLIALLKEPGASFTPGVLNYSLEGSTSNVHRLLLKKSNGDFYLLLWQEIPSFDVTNKTDIINPDVVVTLRLATSITRAQKCLPNDTTSWADAAITNNTLRLSVPDKILIVKLTPGMATL